MNTSSFLCFFKFYSKNPFELFKISFQKSDKALSVPRFVLYRFVNRVELFKISL
jgi:hypothetical protein